MRIFQWFLQATLTFNVILAVSETKYMNLQEQTNSITLTKVCSDNYFMQFSTQAVLSLAVLTFKW